MQTKLFRRDFTLVVIARSFLFSVMPSCDLPYRYIYYGKLDLQHYLVLLLPAPLLQWSFFLWSAAYWLTV